MPKAEVGSTKYLNNKLKSKGLQRLRFWCEVCHKQCRDDNGYKCHVMSESHTRQMQSVGLNANKVISDFSNDFQRNFLNSLRVAHGTKQIHLNRFYQEIIAEKEHVHMNSTRWSSLTEFAKHLGREGLVRVEENDKGLHISWIDNSPDALRRQEAIRKKERQDKGDEEREQRLIQQQIEKARQDANARSTATTKSSEAPVGEDLIRKDGEKIRLKLGSKPETSTATEKAMCEKINDDGSLAQPAAASSTAAISLAPKPSTKTEESNKSKSKNIFAQASKKAAGATKPLPQLATKRPMSEAERIMNEEMARKRGRTAFGGASGPQPKSIRT